MTMVQWWCTGVMLRSNFGWPNPLPPRPPILSAADHLARDQRQAAQTTRPPSCQPTGVLFDRTC